MCTWRRLLPLLAVLLAPTVAGAADLLTSALRAATSDVPAAAVPSGRLLDRALDLAGAARFDGSAASPAADAATFRQLVHQLRLATVAPGAAEAEALPDPRRAIPGVVRLALLDRAVERLRPEAFAIGAARARGGRLELRDAARALESRRVVALAALDAAPAGGEATFVLEPAGVLADPPPRRLEADFGDGAGFREIRPGQPVRAAAGARDVRVRIVREDGGEAFARARVPARAAVAPAPDDTLEITATQPDEGVFGTGRAYVRYAPGHTAIVNPVVVPEGFDLDNSMGWEELYALLDQEGLADTLAAHGYDAVVLDFTDATARIQRNAFVLVELLRQVEAALAPGATVAVVGPSMGGLCSRYALAWMESQGVPHRVRTWISFDSPHAGAVIPLGLQYWIQFFSGQSADAAAFLTQLNSPAARQMLIQHYTDPPSSTPSADPLRAALLADFAAVGDWPAQPRRVAAIDGSPARQTQGFEPGAQLVQWSYSNLLVTILGNVWALRDQASGTIFDGRIRILFSDTRRTVTVSGSPPWDGAPGGYRASLAQLDTVSAPYGDIVALHPNHCFIPTISGLAIGGTGDPFYDVAGDPDLVARTPFAAVFLPAANEDHVSISPGSAAWFLAEIERPVVGAPTRASAPLALSPPEPNPASGPVRLTFTLAAAGAVDVRVFDVAGREVRRLAHAAYGPGTHEVRWDGLDASGAPAPGGLYFARLAAAGGVRTQRIARVR